MQSFTICSQSLYVSSQIFSNSGNVDMLNLKSKNCISCSAFPIDLKTIINLPAPNTQYDIGLIANLVSMYKLYISSNLPLLSSILSASLVIPQFIFVSILSTQKIGLSHFAFLYSLVSSSIISILNQNYNKILKREIHVHLNTRPTKRHIHSAVV